MQKVASLDANCLLRFVLNDLPEQANAVGEAIKASNSLHIADLALVEFVYVLEKQYLLARTTVVSHLEFLMAIPKLNCNRTLFTGVLADYVSSPKVSFTDVCLAYYAALGNTQLLTFDKKLAKKLPQHTRLLV